MLERLVTTFQFITRPTGHTATCLASDGSGFTTGNETNLWTYPTLLLLYRAGLNPKLKTAVDLDESIPGLVTDDNPFCQI